MTTFVLAWLGLSLLFASVVSAGINGFKYRAKIRDLEEQIAVRDVQIFNQEVVIATLKDWLAESEHGPAEWPVFQPRLRAERN